MSAWKKKCNTSKFVDEGTNNSNERGELTSWNRQIWKNGQKNKIKL